MAVAIPGTLGLSGLDQAGALGALTGDPALKLEVLAPINDAIVQSAQHLITGKKVTVHLLEDHKGLYIKACAIYGWERRPATIPIPSVDHFAAGSRSHNQSYITLNR